MENQNNNKNGYLGLVILIGIAILVAVFCTPLVAHAETVPDITTFDKLTKTKFYPFSFRSDSSKSGKLYLMQNPSNGTWSLEDIPNKISSSRPFLCIYMDGEYDGYICIYKGSDCNNVSCMPVYENANSPSGLSYHGLGGSSITENGYYGFFFDTYYFMVDTPYSIKGNYTADDWKTIFRQVVKGNIDITDANAKGSEDNPEYDDEIGTLQLKNVAFVKSNFLNLPSWLEGAVIPQVMVNLFSGDFLVEWKNTTSTGLSLNYYEEKYGKLQYDYFLECRCSYLNIGGSVGDQFPSYGNRSPIRYAQGSVKHISLKASDILDSIEGVKDDWAKCVSDKKEFQLKFRLYIRPKFTQSLTVIPDSSANAKWVCGRWCAVDLKFRDIVLGDDAHAETGEFNENDVWVTDDDTGTDINAGMINADSVDDALDKLHSYDDIDISDYVKNLNAFSEEVKTIPIIIAKLLSFLPAWVPILIGILIGTCCVVGILRILRG